jgi:putative copper export protein
VPAQLPTGHVPGAGGSGASPSAALDAPTLAQVITTWLALAFMTFWVGGLIWETWILPPPLLRDGDLRAGAEAAGSRFRRLTPYALAGVFVADLGIVLSLSVQLAGSWSGAVSLPFLRDIVFGSKFGTYWLLRQVVVVVALALIAVASRLGWSFSRTVTRTQAEQADAPSDAIAPWHRELLAVVRSVPALPLRLARGWLARSWAGRALCVLAGALVVAFALSGHAAAVPSSEFAYAVTVDLTHLFANAAWVGGLFYISVVFVPALQALDPRQRARILALGLPAFGALAITCATLLAATGTLNTTIHLTNIKQFLTTSYGRILAVKIEFFLFMVGISAYHAFILRPRLAHALLAGEAPAGTLIERPVETAIVASGTGESFAPSHREDEPVAITDGSGPPDHVSPRAIRLATRIEDWLVREALIGAVILLCVALLAAFAGSLTPATAAAPPPTGAFVQTQRVQGYAITLKVTPVTFGTNTFTVTVTTDANGAPAQGAAVLLQTQILDMDMGVQNVQLKAVGASAPGVYSGQSDLTMAGHWAVLVKVLPQGSKQFLVATYKFSATY